MRGTRLPLFYTQHFFIQVGGCKLILTDELCADVCILRSGVKCLNCRLLAFQRFDCILYIVQVERRTVFMKQLSSELRHGPARLHFASIQNTNEENGR